MYSRTVKEPGSCHGLGILCLALACVLSCGTRQDMLHLDRVSPDSAAFGSPEHLLLSGAFTPDLAVDLGSTAPPSLENRFEVRIGSERAYDVRFLSRDALEATAPATLLPGRHDITVTDAQGRTSTLPGAFEVVDRGVHRLVFVTSMRSAHPNEWTEPLRIELRDPLGQPAPTSTARTLRITSDSNTGRFAQFGKEEAHAQLEVTLAPGETGVDLVYQDSTPGYHTLESSSRQLPPITQTVAVGRLGPPTRVRFTQVPTSPLVAGVPVPLALEVLDSTGGPASLPATGIQLELRTNSTAGGLAVSEADPYHSALSIVLQAAQGRLPFIYKDTRSSEEVTLSARAFNRDTLDSLESHDVFLVVRPGPTDRFQVLRTSATPPQVGVPERLVIQALDEWGNRTPYSGQVLLDTLPSDPGFSPRGIELIAGLAQFNAEFTRVQTMSVVATDPSAPLVRGASEQYTVRSGPPIQLTVSAVEGSQAAGKSFPLTIQALDRFGNHSDTPLSVMLSAPGVPAGALSPTTSGTFTGAITLPVTITAARDETRLDIVEGTPEAPGMLRTSTGGFSVLPGATQRFVVQDTPGEKTAGNPFRVSIRAVDTYGNTTRDVHDLRLSGDKIHTHQFSPTTFTGFQGQGEVDITVTLASTGTRVLVESGTLESGIIKGQQAGTFAVRAGEFAKFYLEGPGCVTPTNPWLLNIRAFDKWSNLVPSYTGKAVLTLSPFGSVSPSTTGSFVGGSIKETLLLRDVQGREPPSCLNILAADSTDSSKRGDLCLNLRTSCAALN